MENLNLHVGRTPYALTLGHPNRTPYWDALCKLNEKYVGRPIARQESLQALKFDRGVSQVILIKNAVFLA